MEMARLGYVTQDWEMRAGSAKMEKPTHCFHAKKGRQFGLLWEKGPHS